MSKPPEAKPKPQRPRHESGDPEIDRRIAELVSLFGCGRSPTLIAEMILTALKLGRDPVGEGDLKLFNRSLRELRMAARAFAPYAGVRKISVFGSARTPPDDPAFKAAERFAAMMREAGFMVISGGGDGIMGAAQRGAGRDHGFGLNIRLPFEQRANETILGDPKLVTFNYFFTRKLTFLKESHAIALFPGGFGTMDEGFEALTLMQTGKTAIIPITLVDRPGGTYWKTWMRFLEDHLLRLRLVSEDDFRLFHVADSVEAAVAEVAGFYRHYHSSRWVKQQLVIRLTKPLSAGAVASLNNRFEDLLASGDIAARSALPEEADEPSLAGLPRLALTPKRENFGRLRELIDAINDPAAAA